MARTVEVNILGKDPWTVSADAKKLEKLRENVARLSHVVKAAEDLVVGWHQSGFYDRQDPAAALALHEALISYDTGEK